MSLPHLPPPTAGIYLHIPFCRQACIYCNFHFSTSLSHKEDVLQAMMQEIEMQRDYLQGAAIETIYFGGGTPSLLSADEINRLIDAIGKYHTINELKECTLEANPDDLDKTYLRSLRTTPISRFSIGIQSFREQDLLYMKRAHTAQQADAAIKASQDAGFEQLTIDLIYGVPGMDDAAWKQNLAKVAALHIPHFSAYALTVEDKTALQYAIAHKNAAPVDASQSAAQFELLMEAAPAMGYEHYEISNLARPGQYAIHNTNYWRGLPYLGIGPSAHSFDGASRRRWNVSNNARYTQNILREGRLDFEEEILRPHEHLNEYIMTSLRTMWGCDLDVVAQKWGSSVATIVEKSSHLFQEKKWLWQDGRKLLLTAAGKLFADRVASELFLMEL
ncbi:MAG: radical SAM family heme chaperone HemW [Taibaiella sp.]|nr:radical SAM family heme chaperone HemW [Taibaiella sp.]